MAVNNLLVVAYILRGDTILVRKRDLPELAYHNAVAGWREPRSIRELFSLPIWKPYAKSKY
jgi:hypothetical protein